MTPEIVGLILHYQDAARTATCMKSLLIQGVRHILVVDNSADNGKSACALRLLIKENDRFSIISPECNLGFSAGVNAGLQEIARVLRGFPILLINNDAVLLPGALDVLSSELLLNPDATLIYPSIDHGGWIRGLVYYHRLTGLITDARLPGSFPYPSGCCMLINPCLAGSKLFDEEFFMYGEDIELGSRLHSIKGAMIYTPHVLAYHEGSASSGAATLFYETRVVQAHIILIRKLGQGKLENLAFSLGRMFFLPARALIRCIRYKSTIPLKALYREILKD